MKSFLLDNAQHHPTKQPCLALLLLIFTFAAGCSSSPPAGDGSAGNDNSDSETMEECQDAITFDGDGGATPSGTTDFSLRGAKFSGGQVKTVGQTDLYGSGDFAYEVLEASTVVVEFDEPVSSIKLFFVTRGDGNTVLQAFDASGSSVASITAGLPSGGEEVQSVTITGSAIRVEIVHTGDGEGWVDDFEFCALVPASG